MEYSMSGMPEWLSEADEDFTFGAKATSCLHSAATQDAASPSSAAFELPEWMETRDNLGLTNIGLFEDVMLTKDFEDFPLALQDGDVIKDEEDFSATIKPEDMLVPPFNFQPQAQSPQGQSTKPVVVVTEPPKITINVKRVKVPSAATTKSNTGPNSSVPQLYSGMPSAAAIHSQEIVNVVPSYQDTSTIHSQEIVNVVPSYQDTSTIHSQEIVNALPSHQDTPPIDANDLFNELMDMVGTEPKLEGLSDLDSSMVDFLSHLESSNSQLDDSDVSSWGSEPGSPAVLPSPVPSCGSLSPPQSATDLLNTFYSPVPEEKVVSPYYTSQVAWSPGQTAFVGPASPLIISNKDAPSPADRAAPSPADRAAPSPADRAAQSPADRAAPSPADRASDFEADWDQSELHSYSRSPGKNKSRKSNGRVAPYPADKRERKKEQNKQAALRYRHKKKQEDDTIMAQIKAEEERQEKLQAKYDNLKQELACMKKIMREVFIAKGVVSADAFKKKK